MEKKEKDVRKTVFKIRVTETEKNAIRKLQKQTVERSMSNYARKVLMQKPVMVTHHNQSADDFLKEMLSLKKELNAIGNNFNQAVKKLHTLGKIPEFRQWVNGYEENRKTLISHIEVINTRVAQLYEKWSQE